MRMKMKRVFRRNQIIITTLAIMIAAAGYLNYAGKSDLPGADTYEAGATKISDSDIYSENQAVSGSVADGEYEEIASLDDPGEGDKGYTLLFGREAVEEILKRHLGFLVGCLGAGAVIANLFTLDGDSSAVR